MNQEKGDKFKKAFGENLRKIRKEKYPTLSKIDADTKFDSSNYHKYETGKGNPTLTTILELAAGLKIHPKELLNFEFDLNDKE